MARPLTRGDNDQSLTLTILFTIVLLPVVGIAIDFYKQLSCLMFAVGCSPKHLIDWMP